MFDVYDYDDGQGDVEIIADSPEDSTFIPDGLIVFSQRVYSDGE